MTRPPLRFTRHELAGAFGDMGTDLPLLVGVMLAARLDGAGVFIMFGVMQILTGLVYRLPMPAQPLKAMAALVIARQMDGAVLFGAGLAIGVAMLVLSVAGLLDRLAHLIPRSVVRGIQFGLGLQLASIALGTYVQAEGATGYVMAAATFAVVVTLIGHHRVPAALPIVAAASLHAVVFRLDGSIVTGSFGLHLPSVQAPRLSDALTGLLVLALPQIPLSLANSVLATRQLVADLFPDRSVSARAIGLTYAAMNLINPWFGGVPTCHGSGGLAGHYAFGGRTGGSVVIYGALFVGAGLVFGPGLDRIVGAFPLPVLGVLLLFEALALIWLLRDTASSSTDLATAALVGLCAVGLPYGYVVGMVVGTILVRLGSRVRLITSA